MTWRIRDHLTAAFRPKTPGPFISFPTSHRDFCRVRVHHVVFSGFKKITTHLSSFFFENKSKIRLNSSSLIRKSVFSLHYHTIAFASTSTREKHGKHTHTHIAEMATKSLPSSHQTAPNVRLPCQTAGLKDLLGQPTVATWRLVNENPSIIGRLFGDY